MKKILTLIATGVMITTGIFTLESMPTGAPKGATGGVAEGGMTCSQSGCHNGTPSSVTNYVTTDIPATGYVPKRTYNFTVSFTGTGNKGFQLSAQDSVGGFHGKFLTGAGTQVSVANYITHSSVKSASTATWTFKWTAPARGTGKLTFFGAFAITRNITKRTSFVIQENKQIPTVTTLPATAIFHTHAIVHASMNAKAGGAYLASFQYKKEGENWISINANPADISGDSIIEPSIMLVNLLPTTKYIYRACAWNAGDTTWGDTLTFTTTLTGMADPKAISEFMIYPQPANDHINVSLYLNQNSNLTLQIYSLNGQLVHAQNYTNQAFGFNRFNIPLSLSQGIYLVKVASGNQTITRKIIIE